MGEGFVKQSRKTKFYVGERFVKRRFYAGGIRKTEVFTWGEGFVKQRVLRGGGGCETEVFTWGGGSLKGGFYVEEGFVKQRVLRGGGLRKT